jgi:hypothetical protein
MALRATLRYVPHTERIVNSNATLPAARDGNFAVKIAHVAEYAPFGSAGNGRLSWRPRQAFMERLSPNLMMGENSSRTGGEHR